VRPRPVEDHAANPDDTVSMGADSVLLAESANLGEHVWAVLQQHLGHRLVLELGDVEQLDDSLLQQLAWLACQIEAHHGTLRVCGLSAANHARLNRCLASGRMPQFCDRVEAVHGCHRPTQPR